MSKKSNAVINRKNEAERQLSGELQKSVWSLIWQHEPIRLVEISQKLGRRNDSVFTTVKKLIEYKMVQATGKGIYVVSRDILGGEKCA